MSEWIPISELHEHEDIDTPDLLVTASEAQQFLQSMTWRSEVLAGHFVDGFSRMALFQIEMVPTPGSGADDRVWVIAGDVPPAYLDIESCPTAEEALESYVFLLDEWVQAVQSGSDTSELMPVCYRNSTVPVPETEEMAQLVGSRLEFIRRNFLSTQELAGESEG